MSHSILNVVRHQGGSFRLGIICREFQLVPQPNQIIINGINQNPIVFPVNNYYCVHGSIAIWLLKFEFEVRNNSHVFTYVGPSDYKKIPHKREMIDSNGNLSLYHTNEDLVRIVWQG